MCTCCRPSRVSLMLAYFDQSVQSRRLASASRTSFRVLAWSLKPSARLCHGSSACKALARARLTRANRPSRTSPNMYGKSVALRAPSSMVEQRRAWRRTAPIQILGFLDLRIIYKGMISYWGLGHNSAERPEAEGRRLAASRRRRPPAGVCAVSTEPVRVASVEQARSPLRRFRAPIVRPHRAAGRPASGAPDILVSDSWKTGLDE